MNQIRNLWINIISNIVTYIGVYYLLDILFFSSMSTHQIISLTGAWIVTLFVISIVNFAISSLTYSTELNQGKVYLVPPLSGVILIYVGINYLLGNIKSFSTVDYTYIGRYYDGKVFYYFFTPTHMYRSGYDFYSGSDNDILTIKKTLRHIHEDYSRKVATPKVKFREWDGALDAETKRIKAIKNIIE